MTRRVGSWSCRAAPSGTTDGGEKGEDEAIADDEDAGAGNEEEGEEADEEVMEQDDEVGGGGATAWTECTSEARSPPRAEGAVAVDELSALLVRVGGASDNDGWVVRCIPGTTPSFD